MSVHFVASRFARVTPVALGCVIAALATPAAGQRGSSGAGSLPPRRAAITAESTATLEDQRPAASTARSSGSTSAGKITVGPSENYFQKKRTAAPPRNYVIDSQGNPRAYQERSGNLVVTKGTGVLPSEDGQVWREYDISPYTFRVKGKTRPEQAIIDWILRETGTDVWFSPPLGVLSADSRTLRCYHTPQMQKTVQSVVERFVNASGEAHVLAIRVMTLTSPSWRVKALPLVKPVDVKSAGVEAWLLSRENAAVLVADLKRRGDYRELNAPNLQIQSGQSETIAKTTPRQYARSVRPTSVFPGYEVVPGQLDEGFALNVSSLMSLDGKACDVVVKCNVDQVEKLVPISLEIPVGGVTQKVQIQVPQLVSWRLHERFRWPSDQVLLLSCGVVASPTGEATTPIPLLGSLSGGNSRADALLMIEHKGAGYLGPVEFVPSQLSPAAAGGTTSNSASGPAATTATPSVPSFINTRGRY
ncbi:MAG TPA: hypothetical protein VFB96_21515 [Pirellulaceae bacterium]|nr:hypothetical protein [Pirellulaceae bacterium]